MKRQFGSFCKKYPTLTACLVGTTFVEVLIIVYAGPYVLNIPLRMPTFTRNIGSGAWAWWVIGIALVVMFSFILIANRKKIAGWFTGGSWKTALWWVGGIAILALIAWGCVAVYSHWSAIKAWSYWLYVLIGVPCITIFIFGIRSPKPVGEGFKKTLEFLIALAKLAALVAITGVLFVFIVGPTKFWGQPMVIQQVPQTNVAIRQTTPTAPVNRNITVPVGDINAPIDKWSEEVKVVTGWNFRYDVTGQMGKMGVLVDGSTKVVSEPGKNADTHASQSLRFISLEGRPITIAVAYYR